MENFKRIAKIIGYAVLGVVIIVLAYLCYVFAAYHRIEDHQQLEVYSSVSSAGEVKTYPTMQTGVEYKIVTYNIGFGAYSPDFSFFMDGGESSWAASEESSRNLVTGAAQLVSSFKPDFVLMQEIDTDSTRTYHLNQLELVANELSGYAYTYALNYDSPFLLYPFNEPHGASVAGIGTFSKYGITSAERRSLPISTGLTKVVDLDRCYSVNRVQVSNGKELVIINVHLTAYGSSPEVREGQTTMLREEIAKEYAAGNYVIVGGDFNHNLKSKSDSADTLEWAHCFDRNLLPEHCSFALDGLSTKDFVELPDSCRDSGVPYVEGSTATVTLDGFIITDNIECVTYTNYYEGFTYSDHEPVIMTFILK